MSIPGVQVCVWIARLLVTQALAELAALILLAAAEPASTQAAFGVAAKWHAADELGIQVADMAADTAGNVYAVTSALPPDVIPVPPTSDQEGTAPAVRQYAADGTLIAEWGTEGVADGQFRRPFGIATDAADNVYVTDVGNDRVQKLTVGGAFLAKWGHAGSGPGEFDNPRDVAVDPAGNVYVADTGNDRIQKFNSRGEYLGAWPALAEDIATDSGGNVYASSERFNAIQKFAPDGTMIAEWPVPDGTTDVATDRLGNVYVPGPVWPMAPGTIQVLTSDGALIDSFGCWAFARDEFLNFGTDIEVVPDPSGGAFVAGWLGSAGIVRFADPGGPMPCKALEVSRDYRQFLDRLRIAVGCPAQPCELRVSGTVGVARMQTRLRTVELSLPADRQTSIELAVQHRQMLDEFEDALMALRGGSALYPPQVEVKVRTAVDSTNNFATEQASICLRRPGPNPDRRTANQRPRGSLRCYHSFRR